MGLVASSKIRRANEAMAKSREYTKALGDVIETLSSSRECQKSPFMRKSYANGSSDYDISRTRLIVIAGDRGLAGGYNANIMRLTATFKGAQIIPIGKRTCEKFKAEIVSSERFDSESAAKLAKKLCADFAAGEFDRLGIISTKYVSMMTQTAQVTWVLPLEAKNDSEAPTSILFEPDEISVLNAVVPEYVAGLLYGCIRESFASEVAARRMAMDSAGKNATEMIDDLTLKYNRARQGTITQEITEIVAGAGENS